MSIPCLPCSARVGTGRDAWPQATPRPVPLVATIQRETAREYGLAAEIMREPDALGTRLKARARPRQEAMYLSRLLTRHSTVRIGQLFGGRDHSTVIFACRRTEQRIAAEPETRAALGRIAERAMG